MQPNHCDSLGQVREPRAASQLMRDGHPREHGQPRPSGAAPMRSEDSWIEVSSQPSSSSLSSAATNEDIITTGLRVEHREAAMYQHRNRRRRMQHLAAVTTAQIDYSSREASLASSSQEEYEESESEPDPSLSSSNEDINRPGLPAVLPARSQPSSQSDETSSDDEDDTSTALGMGISPSPFVPQPNVFSHPPHTQDPSWTRPGESRRSQPSVLSNSSRRTAIRRDSYPSARSSRRSHQSQHSPYNMISPSYHADHDAALRASLSTLLSCAAAARGLPKPDPQPAPSGPSGAVQPSTFRLVGESVAMGEESDGEPPSSPRYTETSPAAGPPRRRQPHAVAPYSPPKSKRRSSSPKDRSVASKKSRRASMTNSATPASPTIMTWVISAGVVVLFSAISFSAGYMLGREVGRAEIGIMGDGGVPGARSSAACGQEAVRGGLKRFRWGTAAAGSASLA
ncbi:uncharacterized protein N7459_000626 [Penicillium hispanicum]|uniref:uncharacterized protein n=1 Tax=Penicillium hispanicum TaxID=1080232 RepID=UPI0025408C2B|nr:uncharacterized protein N7459_000626 [Penicillium hispanicum]KAJ5594418.1 hypothetical protein N7459_000626 [Penicillium hispanicum]